MNEDLYDLLDLLADLSLNAPTFEIALAALRLQTMLKEEFDV